MLKDRLEKISAASANKIPADTLAIMKQAKENLLASGIMDKTIRVGDEVPGFSLEDGHSKLVSLASLLQQGPVLIAIYRGVWWPYCNAELDALQELLPEIKRAGASLVAVSPMLSKYTPQLVNKLGLTFPVLSDPDSQFLQQLGVVFELPDEMIKIYKGFGIDLERFNDDNNWRLPLPGRIIIDQMGIAQHVELSTDHTERPEPMEAVEILNNLS